MGTMTGLGETCTAKPKKSKKWRNLPPKPCFYPNERICLGHSIPTNTTVPNIPHREKHESKTSKTKTKNQPNNRNFEKQKKKVNIFDAEKILNKCPTARRVSDLIFVR